MPVNNSSSNFKCFLVHFNNHEALQRKHISLVDTCNCKKLCHVYLERDAVGFFLILFMNILHMEDIQMWMCFFSNYILFSITEYETVLSGNLQQELRSKTPVTSRVIKMHSEPGQGLSGWKTPVGLKHVFFIFTPFLGRRFPIWCICVADGWLSSFYISHINKKQWS